MQEGEGTNSFMCVSTQLKQAQQIAPAFATLGIRETSRVVHSLPDKVYAGQVCSSPNPPHRD